MVVGLFFKRLKKWYGLTQRIKVACGWISINVDAAHNPRSHSVGHKWDFSCQSKVHKSVKSVIYHIYYTHSLQPDFLFSTNSGNIWKNTFQLSFRASQSLSCDVFWILLLLNVPKDWSWGLVTAYRKLREWTLVALTRTLNRPDRELWWTFPIRKPQHFFNVRRDLTACFCRTDQLFSAVGVQIWCSEFAKPYSHVLPLSHCLGQAMLH